MSSRVVIDTGPLVAVLTAETTSDVCADVFSKLTEPPLTTWPVITEACWLLRKKPLAIRDILDMIANRAVIVVDLDLSDVTAIRQTMQKYQEMGAQLADASLVRLAEREKASTVFTLDRRDFSIYRTSTGKALQIVPEF